MSEFSNRNLEDDPDFTILDSDDRGLGTPRKRRCGQALSTWSNADVVAVARVSGPKQANPPFGQAFSRHSRTNLASTAERQCKIPAVPEQYQGQAAKKGARSNPAGLSP